MSYFFSIAAATFLLVHSSLVQEWELFVDPGGKFQVLMPDTVVSHEKTVETDIGFLEFVTHSSKVMTEEGVVIYNMGYTDYPEGVLHKDSVDLIREFFNETIDGAVESVEGELIYEDDYSSSFYPTRTWKIKSEKIGMNIKSMAMVVSDRYYHLQSITPLEMSISHDQSEKFFNSFKVTR